MMALIGSGLLALSVAATALAVNRLYPVEVREYDVDGVRHLEKVYELSPEADPEDIPVGNFDQDGVLYRLLDITKKSKTDTDTREYTEEITLDSATSNLDSILPTLAPEREVTTADGYKGVLTLDKDSVSVEAKGFQSSAKTFTATRTYADLTDCDLSLVPKSVDEGGVTLTLSDVRCTSGKFNP